MKLLPKSEIDRRKQEEKNLEIQEGLKLSRRVDSLRKLSSEEEANLERFRTQTLASIHAEITEASEKRDKVQKEVDKLEVKLSKMLPDMATEREALAKQKKSLDKRETEVQAKEEQAELKEIDVALALKRAEDSALRKESHEKIVEKLHLEAEKDREEAKNRLSSAKQTEKTALQLKKDTETEAELRSNAISLKERELEEREEQNKQTSKELAAEKIRLADMRRTLEGELRRIKQNRL